MEEVNNIKLVDICFKLVCLMCLFNSFNSDGVSVYRVFVVVVVVIGHRIVIGLHSVVGLRPLTYKFRRRYSEATFQVLFVILWSLM